MSANWELQLVSAISTEKNFKEVIDAGVSIKTFANAEARMVFEFILAYYNDSRHYGEIASTALIKQEFPTVDLPTPLQSVTALCQIVSDNALRRVLRDLHASIAVQIEEDPRAALEVLRDRARTIGELHSETDDVHFEEEAADALKIEYAAAKTGRAPGLQFPWPELNQIAGPITLGDLVVIYGLPKSLKTWMALLTATTNYEHSNSRVLIYSREMNMLRLMKRVACLLTKSNYDEFCTGKLSEDQETYVFAYLDWLKEQATNPDQYRSIIFTKGMSKTDMAMPILRRKIDSYKPDLVILDSAYHLSATMDWRDISKLTQGIKGIADDTKVPIIAVTQENERAAVTYKGGRGTASIAQSPSWSQDADTLIRAVRKTYLSIIVPAAREVKASGTGIRCIGRPADDWSFVDYDVDDAGDNESNEAASQPKTPEEVGALGNSFVGKRTPGKY